MKHIVTLFFTFVIQFAICKAMAQENGDSVAIHDENFVTASILVVSPGESIESQFGHSCLRLQCPSEKLDFIFSNEGEGVANNPYKFFSGSSRMAVKAIPTKEYIDQYKAEGREVDEYTLNLPIRIKQDLWQEMDERLEDHDFPYDFLNKGCTVSVLNWLETTIGPDSLDYGNWPEKFANSRNEIGGYCVKNEWHKFILRTIVSGEANYLDIDNTKKAVVPTDLVQLLQHTKAFGKTLITEKPRVLLAKTKDPQQPWITPLYCAILFLCIALLNLKIKSSIIDILVLLPSYCLGLVVWYLVCFSDFPATQWNVLMIPFNPFTIILWKWRRKWIYPFIAVCLIWAACLLFYPHRIVEPAHIVYVIGTLLTYLKIKKYKTI